MIVCICANVSEDVIINLAKQGNSFEQIQLLTNVCKSCKTCELDIHQIIDCSQPRDDSHAEFNRISLSNPN